MLRAMASLSECVCGGADSTPSLGSILSLNFRSNLQPTNLRTAVSLRNPAPSFNAAMVERLYDEIDEVSMIVCWVGLPDVKEELSEPDRNDFGNPDRSSPCRASCIWALLCIAE